MNDAGLAAMRDYLKNNGLIANPPAPAILPAALIIEAGHMIVTLYGTPTPADRAYFAEMTTLVHGATQARQTTMEER